MTIATCGSACVCCLNTCMPRVCPVRVLHPRSAGAGAQHRSEARVWGRRLAVGLLPTVLVAVFSMLPMLPALKWWVARL